MDSAKVSADYPVVPVGPQDRPDRGQAQQIRVLDYVSLTAHNPALAALFTKHGVSPEQFWALQVTMKKAQLREARKRAGRADPAALNAMGRFAVTNLAIMEAHQAELNTAGIQF